MKQQQRAQVFQFDWENMSQKTAEFILHLFKVVVLHKTKFCKRKSDLKVCFFIFDVILSDFPRWPNWHSKNLHQGFFPLFSDWDCFAVQSLNGNRDTKSQCNRASHFLLRRNKWKCLQDRLLLILITPFFSALSLLLLSVIFHICHFFFPLWLKDITDLKKAVNDANKTETLRHSQSEEHISTLFSTIANLQQRVSLLENGTKQSVSTVPDFGLHLLKAECWFLLTSQRF